MNTTAEYALLAASSYLDLRVIADNEPPVPTGWQELKKYSASGSGENANWVSAGFSARVFKNSATGEVVVSYAGTEFGKIGGTAMDLILADPPLGLGLGSPQVDFTANLNQAFVADIARS